MTGKDHKQEVEEKETCDAPCKKETIEKQARELVDKLRNHPLPIEFIESYPYQSRTQQ